MPLTKNEFRKKCQQKSKKSMDANPLYKDASINKALIQELRAGKRKNILFYYPLQQEANILKALYRLRKKHRIFLPFMVGKSFKMVPFRLPLQKKKFQIFEAGNSLYDRKKIDIAIVPVVGVDGNFQRVGFGKGMYDRFFEKLQERPYTIFIQRDLCCTRQKICDSYDITADLMITADKKIIKRKYRC